MFIYNLKINKNKIAKIIMIILCSIVLGLTSVIIINFIKSADTEKNLIDDSIPNNEFAEIKPQNYTNILKEVHNNIDTYINQKISFTGYVYRVDDLNENQFILARDMDIGNHQTVVVGFLCNSDQIKNYDTYSWIKINGEITKGNYKNSDMPILNIISIEPCTKPENPSVPMPDDSYVPTAVIY